MNPSMTRWKIVPLYSGSVVLVPVAGWVHSRRPSARSAKLATVLGAWSGNRSTLMSPWLVCRTARRAAGGWSVTGTTLPLRLVGGPGGPVRRRGVGGPGGLAGGGGAAVAVGAGAARRGRATPLRCALSGSWSGDEGNRTPNPRLAKAVLCQLSYVPRRTREDRARWIRRRGGC